LKKKATKKKENAWKIKKQNFKTEKTGSKINGKKMERQKGKTRKTMDLSTCVFFCFFDVFFLLFFFLPGRNQKQKSKKQIEKAK